MSPGCRNCYAERMAIRLMGAGHPHYREGFKPAVHPDALILPLRWRKPRMIFVNSMSDLFHEEIPLRFIREVFAVMREAHWHIFQVLTKRSGRLLELAHEIKWPPNVWMGVSVETSKYLYRIDHLRKVPAALRFISFEPLLGPMPDDMDLTGIDWIIVGGESGPGARPVKEEWVIGIRDQCVRAGIPFFFKQWGGVRKKEAGRILEGKVWDEMPKTPKLIPLPRP